LPTIDVDEVLISDDIAGSTFTVTRRVETVGSNGRPTITTSTLTGVGSIVPTGDNSLVREEAYTQQLNSIKVITSLRLYGAGVDTKGVKYQPDIITWRNGTYIVRVVNDYSVYGAGLVEAECIAYQYNAQQPQN
jgi:hypothetical protein